MTDNDKELDAAFEKLQADLQRMYGGDRSNKARNDFSWELPMSEKIKVAMAVVSLAVIFFGFGIVIGELF